MSLLDRRSLLRLALPLAALGLGACGFTPVYAPGGAGAALRGQVLVQEPTTQPGYLLARQLETRLGRSSPAARYALDMTLDVAEEGLAINSAGDITRYNLIGEAGFALRDTTTGSIVTSGDVRNFTAYSATGTTVATLAAERDAVERLMTILADQIVARLFTTALPA